jgi:hypothetical protein
MDGYRYHDGYGYGCGYGDAHRGDYEDGHAIDSLYIDLVKCSIM